MFTVRIQEPDFDIAAEIDALTRQNAAIGAVVTFTGKVRSSDPDRPLTAMTLEHYPGMAEKQMYALLDEAQARWSSLQAATVIHRYGRLTPKDNIVLVITCSPHREDAFNAAEFLMDWLKTKAPFWKKEIFDGADAGWVEARASDDAATARWD